MKIIVVYAVVQVFQMVIVIVKETKMIVKELVVELFIMMNVMYAVVQVFL